MSQAVMTPAPTAPRSLDVDHGAVTSPGDELWVPPPEPPSRRASKGRGWLYLLGAGIPIMCTVGLMTFGHSGESAEHLASDLSSTMAAPVTCASDLPATVGATTICTVQGRDGAHRVQVRVTSVHGAKRINQAVSYTTVAQD